jgi:hypothetical protein
MTAETVFQDAEAALDALDQIAPGVPLLALGQTVFWDEPVKAGLALVASRRAIPRRFVAGVHDTDYFAKLPSKAGSGYRAFPHNDTTTQTFWSAAAEFSSLFGSETVVTRDILSAAGVRLAKVSKARPKILDDATEAFGWRGVADLSHTTGVVAETPLDPVFPVLRETLANAVQESLQRLGGPSCERAEDPSDQLWRMVDEAAQTPGQSLSDFYQALLPGLYSFTAGEEVPVEPTATTSLLRFNSLTQHLPRFELVERFLNPLTRTEAVHAYDDTMRGTEMYTLDRFGSWALPFDVVVPGRGRGTLRVAPKAIIIMTPTPLFITLRKPITGVRDLAEAIERKFGPDCTLVGKAVTLIGMLAREFVFVFHEGASSYVHRSRTLHQRLYANDAIKPTFHPLLRAKYSPWDSLTACCAWFRLPPPFHWPFGQEELCGRTFAGRWRQVAQVQTRLLSELATLRRPLAFINWLSEQGLGTWQTLAEEYRRLQVRLDQLQREIAEVKAKKSNLLRLVRDLRAERDRTEHEKGRHWRSCIFEKEASPEDWAERERYQTRLGEIDAKIRENLNLYRLEADAQSNLVRDPAIISVHERRREIELEAELKRMKLARQAVITSRGLARAGFRPSAWWFPLVCPDGAWFRRTVQTAEYYLEPLQ